MRKDYAKGTRVRLLASGLEGIIIDYEIDSLESVKYVVEMAYGETRLAAYDDLAPHDHPIQAMLDAWNAEGRARGFTSIFVGVTKEGTWKAFFGKLPADYARTVRENRDVKFKYYWALRGS
jgi:hypothetical protein